MRTHKALSPELRTFLSGLAADCAELAAEGVPGAAEESRKIMEILRKDRRIRV